MRVRALAGALVNRLCGSHPQRAEVRIPHPHVHLHGCSFTHSLIHSFIQKTFTKSLGDTTILVARNSAVK